MKIEGKEIVYPNLALFLQTITWLMGEGKSENIETVLEKMFNSTLVSYLCQKHSDFFSRFYSNFQELKNLDKMYNDLGGSLDIGDVEKKYCISNSKDGLLLVVSMGLNAVLETK